MKSAPIVPGNKPRMDIGYKYIYQKVLLFIATDGGGSTEPGVPYLYFYPGNYYNISVFPIFCPRVVVRCVCFLATSW